MLSKADIKYIKSLQIKKYRKQEQCFVVEGAKTVQELLQSDFVVKKVIGTNEFLSKNPVADRTEVVEVSEKVLEGIGEFQSNNAVIAIAEMRSNKKVEINADEFALVLDDIRDPGNLGTIIRTADWYGIQHIIASEETADFYNPKVISATMGSFTRVQIFYTDLVSYLRPYQQPIFGAFLEGKNIHEVKFGSGGLIVIGNESRGISDAVKQFVTDKITIPRFGQAESLNAAIATAVICDNVRRSR
jgi:RNA methyltransferase, TrmH family